MPMSTVASQPAQQCVRMLMRAPCALRPAIADRAYDLVSAMDVPEHFEPGQGLAALAHCRRIAGRAALVSTPKAFHAQQVPANPYENHRSVWTRQQLADAGYVHLLDNDESWIVIAGEGPD